MIKLSSQYVRNSKRSTETINDITSVTARVQVAYNLECLIVGQFFNVRDVVISSWVNKND